MQAVKGDLRFEIVEDRPDIGAYLYIYKNEKCIEDYLQDSVAMCQQQANEDWGVPLESWVK